MNLSYLSSLNKHERDSHITFEEGPHIYTIDGDSNYTSVTTWNHSHFEPFNADKIICNMMKGKNWINSQYYGMTTDEIKQKWEINRDECASAGTKMHYDIECFYNNNEVENNSIEYSYFMKFKEDYKDLIPYRTEWMIYDKELKLAGSIDMIFMNKEGNLEIYDWKRCKQIKKKAYGKKSITPSISHLDDSNFWHYSLQLNTYKAIIEKNYGKKITKMCLVCLHPNNENQSYLRYEVPDLSSDIKHLFNNKLLQLTDNNLFITNQLKEKQEMVLKKYKKYKKLFNNVKDELDNITNKIEKYKKNIDDIEVSTFLYNNMEYLVDEDTNIVYNEDGEKIGYWLKGTGLL